MLGKHSSIEHNPHSNPSDKQLYLSTASRSSALEYIFAVFELIDPYDYTTIYDLMVLKATLNKYKSRDLPCISNLYKHRHDYNLKYFFPMDWRGGWLSG